MSNQEMSVGLREPSRWGPGRDPASAIQFTGGAQPSIIFALMDTIPALVSFVTRDERYGWVNRQYEQFFGKSRDEIIGRPAGEILGEALSRMLPHFRRALDGEIVHYENTLLHHAGAPRRLDTTYVPYRGPDNAIIGVLVFAFDVTRHWETTERLRESELRFRQLAENIQEVFWMSSGDGKEVLYVSPAFEQVWQHTTAELYCRPSLWLDLIHPDDRPGVESKYTPENLAQTKFDVEYRIVRRDGSLRWIHDRGFPVRDESGRVVGIAGLAEDVTAVKQALDRERHLLSDLAHMARLTTMGEMATGLAHELNQPLSAVVNYIDASMRLMSRSSEPSADVRAAMENAAAEAQRAGNILHHMTTFLSRAGPQQTSVDLNALIREALTVAARLLHLNEIQLICELAEDLPAVLADRIQIEQVVLNLIRNALEAMWQTPAPERKLTVKTERADESMLRATVSDSGCGLPPDAEICLFRPFFTTKSAGMGMGLAISRTILTAHGGVLEAHHNTPRGAVFTFTLPIVGRGTAP